MMKTISKIVLLAAAIVAMMPLSVFGEETCKEYSAKEALGAYLTGTVRNQDGKPVAGATVAFCYNQSAYQGVTDSEGRYDICIDDGSGIEYAEVTCEGYSSFHSSFGKMIASQQTADFTLRDAVRYEAGRCATIILPVQPDATAGRYYRLSAFEDRRVLVFDREQKPEPNVPYLFVPYEDYTVDLSELDLSVEPGFAKASTTDFNPESFDVPVGTERVDAVFFRGSYRDVEYKEVDKYYYYFVDDEASCGTIIKNNIGGYKVGACHADIEILWQVVDRDELKLKLVEADGCAAYVCPTGIEHVDAGRTPGSEPSQEADCYYSIDGKRINSRPARKGIYIRNNRLVVIQ